MKNNAIRIMVLVGLLICANVAANEWKADYSKSAIKFTATWEGLAFSGMFKTWKTKIEFDPIHPQQGRIETSVQISSVDTQSRDRDEGMQESDWFSVSEYPEALFVSDKIVSKGDGFVAVGELTIKGKTKNVQLPFHWQESNGVAQFNGTILLNRTDFDIGIGEWSTGELIGLEVPVEVDVRLSR